MNDKDIEMKDILPPSFIPPPLSSESQLKALKKIRETMDDAKIIEQIDKDIEKLTKNIELDD